MIIGENLAHMRTEKEQNIMADLGALETFLDHDAVTYSVGGEDKSFIFPADAVLRFKVEVAKLQENEQARIQPLDVYALTAPILGSKFNKTKATFEGGVLGELLKSGQPFVVIDRLLNAVFVKLQYQSDELAEAVFRHGDLGKAIRERAERIREETARTEMSEDAPDDTRMDSPETT